MAERPSWDDYFMQIAHLVKTRATCPGGRSERSSFVKDESSPQDITARREGCNTARTAVPSMTGLGAA